MRAQFLLATLVVLASFGVFINLTAADTLTTVTKFDDFVKVLKRVSKIAEKIRFIEAVWGEVRADYPEDLKKATLLYQQFDGLTSSNDADEAQAAFELQQEIRRHLRTKNAELLANAFNGNEFPNTKELLKFYDYLNENYEAKLVQDIFASAIDDVYAFRPANVLAAFLWETYSVTKTLESFDLMLHVQLHLYWKFMAEEDINDTYLFNMGYYMSQVQKDELYVKLDDQLKRRVTLTVNSLPSGVQALFFASKFCLKNKSYNEYLITRDNTDIDANRRYVQTLRSGAKNVTANWVREYAEDMGSTDGSLNLKFSLKGNNQMYLYLERTLPAFMDLIAAWRVTENIPTTKKWNLEFIENALVFTQDGFIMCSSDKVYDALGRLVYGYMDYMHTRLNTACQWVPETC